MPAKDTITLENASKVYTGEAQSLTITGDLPTGVTVSYEGTGTNASEEPYTITAIFTGDADIEKNYAIGNDEAIVTVEDYTDYLFPENRSWMETRDVLLIYIYQKLHEKNIKVEIEENDDFNDDIFMDENE